MTNCHFKSLSAMKTNSQSASFTAVYTQTADDDIPRKTQWINSRLAQSLHAFALSVQKAV